MKTIAYHTADKSTWDDGPWQEEPDKLQWLDEETGMPCLVVRNQSGALCGYVGVSKSHPFHGKGYNDCKIPDGPEEWDYGPYVHGGLTFADSCHPGDEARHICHVVEDGEDDNVWWLGFDCAHSGDMSPAIWAGASKAFLKVMKDETYKDLAYVQSECRKLAKQLKEFGSDGSPSAGEPSASD